MRASDGPAGEGKDTCAWPWTKLELTCRVWLGGQMKKKVWTQHMIWVCGNWPIDSNGCVVFAFCSYSGATLFQPFQGWQLVG